MAMAWRGAKENTAVMGTHCAPCSAQEGLDKLSEFWWCKVSEDSNHEARRQLRGGDPYGFEFSVLLPSRISRVDGTSRLGGQVRMPTNTSKES